MGHDARTIGRDIMIFKPLSYQDMETVRGWRNDIMETLRTPYELTEEMQQDFYREVICDRRGSTRYWGFWRGSNLVGYGGIENIEWENRRGEISVLIAPRRRGEGLGAAAVASILTRAFDYLNLDIVHGECYYSSKAVDFWYKMAVRYNGHTTVLPGTKYYKRRYWSSLLFVFTKPQTDVPDMDIVRKL